MVAVESEEARQATVMLSQEKPDTLVSKIKKMQNLDLPPRHQIDVHDIHPDRLYKIFTKTYENVLKDFESLLGIEGVGPKTIRALAFISEIIYSKTPSFDDPVRYSFAHGGKNGHPYPVNREVYDRSIEVLRNALEQTKVGNNEKIDAIKRLSYFLKDTV
jgi:hypothetical protein